MAAMTEKRTGKRNGRSRRRILTYGLQAAGSQVTATGGELHRARTHGVTVTDANGCTKSSAVY